MSRQVQMRRGSATQHDEFIGAMGEITMDTTAKTLRVHDGVTAGGIPLARRDELGTAGDVVVETGQTDRGWFRRYRSGWVEQGGTANDANIIFPVEFSTTDYTVNAIAQMVSDGVGTISICYANKRTSAISIQVRWNGGAKDIAPRMWSACGF